MQPTEEPGWANIESEVRVPNGSARVISYRSGHWIDVTGTTRGYRLEMRLVQGQCKTARACFPDRWPKARREPLGDLYLIPAGETIHVVGPAARQSSLVCEFDSHSVETWFGEDLDWSRLCLSQCLDVASPALRATLSRLAHEMRNPSLASEAMSEVCLTQATFELVRVLGALGGRYATGGLAGWRLKHIDERLNAPGPAPSLSELANLVGLSVRQMSRGYQTARGRSLGAAIAAAQAGHAQRLLRDGMSIAEVASKLGFAGPSSFSCAFKRSTGIAPRDFRAQAGQLIG